VAARPRTSSRARRPRGGGAVVVPLERRGARPGIDISRFLPGGRSLAVALGLLALGVGAYAVARGTSALAVQTIDVRGATPGVAARVRSALEPWVGKSLVSLSGGDVARRLESLPFVARARVDRDFPHTLRVFVRPERPIAVVRRGSESWLVSVRSRVMARLRPGAHPELPRIWVAANVPLTPADLLSGDPARAVTALHPLVGRTFLRQISTVHAEPGELTLVLNSGLRLRLGDLSNLRLKLVVGERVAQQVDGSATYADLTMPQRPVVG
jgi:cell division protein FtsQ